MTKTIRTRLLAAGCLLLAVTIGVVAFSLSSSGSTSKPATSPQDDRVFSFLGAEKMLHYVSSKTAADGVSKTHTYRDDEKNQYTLNPERNSFSIFVDFNNRKPSFEDATEPTKELADRYFDTLFASAVAFLPDAPKDAKPNCEYVREQFNEYTGITSYSYERTINGFMTEENASISIDQSGCLSSCNIRNVGLFDGVTLPKIDMAKVEAEVERTVKEKYKDEFVSCFIDSKRLDIREGKLFLEGNVVVKFLIDDGIEMSALEEIFIPLD